MKILKNFIDDVLNKEEQLYLEYIITNLETTFEKNKINRDNQTTKVNKKNNNKHKKSEENMRHSSTYFIEETITFTYSKYFKLLKKGNKKLKIY
jgi:hypothetical protein